MGYKFNPLTGQLDLVGTSGGGGGGGLADRYFGIFNNTTDWTLNSPNYTKTILAAAHSKGVHPSVQVFELNGSDYEEINVGVVVNASGDVTITVTEAPDNRFVGLVLII